MAARLAAAAWVLAVSCIAASTLAQDQQGRFERRLEQVRRDAIPPALEQEPDIAIPLAKRALIDYGGFLVFNYFSLDDNEQNTHILREYDLIGYAHVNIDGRHDFYARGRASYFDFNEGDSFDGDGDESEFELERAHYRFDLRDPAGDRRLLSEAKISAQVGRQLVFWGNGLVLSNVMDGGVVSIRSGPWEVSVIAGVTWDETIDFDTSRPDFDDDTQRGLYGGIVSVGLGKHRPFGYVLIQEDYNDDDLLTTGGVETRFEYDSRYFGLGAEGAIGDRLLYSVEAVYEGGRGLSNSFQPAGASLEQLRQRKEEIEALAADVRLDYLLNDARNTRLSGEFIFATGDDDRQHSSNTFAGNRPGTTDRAFNALGLINSGLAFSPAVSNLVAVRAGAATFPIPGDGMLGRLQVGMDVFVYWKQEAQGPIDEATEDERYLGWEPDVYLNWQVTEEFSLAVRYGVFFPGSAFGDDNDSRQSLFVGVTYAF